MMYWNDVSDNIGFLLQGLWVTIQLSLIVLILSLAIGTILGIARFSKFQPISILATGYIEFTRSIPLILFIVFIHYGFLPFLIKENSSFFISAIIALTIVFASYIAEIIRGGLQSVETEYIEAARSLGLNYGQMMIYIILPIVVSRMIPALVSQFISIIKETSLASLLGLVELTGAAHIIYSQTHHELELLLFTAFVYFIICYCLSYLSRKLEPQYAASLSDYIFDK